MDCQSPAVADDTLRNARSASAGSERSGAERHRQRPAAPVSIDRMSAHRRLAAVAGGASRRRVHIGDLVVDLRYFARQANVEYRTEPGRALLLVPLTDDVEIVTETSRLSCPARTPFLFARDEAATVVWHAATWGLAIHLRRDKINATASAVLGDAKRLTSIATMLEGGESQDAIEAIAERLISHIGGAKQQDGPAMLALEASFYRGLFDRIVAQEQVGEPFSRVRAVSEAMRIVRGNHSRVFDTEALAAAVGVTGQTLRKSFRSTLGLSVREFIQMVRLDWAHQALSSRYDGRRIAEIAREAGFADAPRFSRAYMKGFGEPPSQTRARVVRAGPE